MPIDYSNEGDKFARLPKSNEPSKEFVVKSCEKIVDKDFRYNLPNVDYRLVYRLENGQSFMVNSWKAFYAFRDANVQEGDHIRVHHPFAGKWEVEVLNR